MSYTVCTLQYLQFAVQKTWVTCKTATTANCTNCIYKKGGTMTEYRFTLQKYKRGSKLTCPKCGRKQCFVKYVDTEGQIAFPDYVGRCDHEHSCQYHYKPSDYFKDNPVALEERKSWKSQAKVMQPKPTDYIDRDIMHRSLANYELNPLFIFLSGVLGEKETIPAVQIILCRDIQEMGRLHGVLAD